MSSTVGRQSSPSSSLARTITALSHPSHRLLASFYCTHPSNQYQNYLRDNVNIWAHTFQSSNSTQLLWDERQTRFNARPLLMPHDSALFSYLLYLNNITTILNFYFWNILDSLTHFGFCRFHIPYFCLESWYFFSDSVNLPWWPLDRGIVSYFVLLELLLLFPSQ